MGRNIVSGENSRRELLDDAGPADEDARQIQSMINNSIHEHNERINASMHEIEERKVTKSERPEATASMQGSSRSNKSKQEASAPDVSPDEMRKILAAQKNRQRSYSVAPNSQNAPVLQPIKNFGHGRRSNLMSKVQQLQRRAQRSRSIAVGDINQHNKLLQQQILIANNQLRKGGP